MFVRSSVSFRFNILGLLYLILAQTSDNPFARWLWILLAFIAFSLLIYMEYKSRD